MLKVTALNAFPANSNPFSHDLFRVGQEMREDDGWLVMWGTDKDRFVVVDTQSGERIEICRSKASESGLPDLMFSQDEYGDSVVFEGKSQTGGIQ